MKRKKKETQLDYTKLEKELYRLKKTSQSEKEKLQTLLDISSDLYESKTFEDIGKTIESNLSRFNLGKGFGVKLGVYDTVEDLYRIVFQTEADTESHKRINILTNKVSRLNEIAYYSKIAIEQRKTLFIEDNHADYSLGIDIRQKDVESQSMVFIPLFYRDDLVGLLSCARTPEKSIDKDFIIFLESIAKYVSISVGELLIEKRQGEQLKLQTLLDISAGLYKANTFEDIGKTVVDNLDRFILKEAIGTKLAVYDIDEDKYFIAFQTPPTHKAHENVIIPTNESFSIKDVKYFSGITIEQKKTLIIQDNHSEYSLNIDLRQKDFPKHSMIFIPLFGGENLVGLLSCARSPENSMDSDFVDFLESVAKYVSIAVGKALNEKRRKKIEREILESEKRYRSLVDTSPDGIAFTDMAGKIILCNQKIIEMQGYEKTDDFVNKNIFGILAPESLQNVKKDMKKLLTSGNIKNIEYELIRKDGSRYSAEVSATLLRDNKKKPYRVIATARDITERKQAEEAIAYERYLFKTLMDTIPDNIYFKDKESKFIRINKALAKWFNLKSPDDAVGKNDFEFFGEERDEEPLKDEKQILQTGQPIVNKDEIEKWPDGRITWASTTKMPLKDKNGIIIGTFGISRNITDRKLMEQTLAYERYLFTSLMDNIPDFIYYKDIEGKFTRVNTSMAKWLDLNNPDEAVGKTVFDFYQKEAAKLYSRDENKILNNGEGPINIEEINVSKNGKIGWVVSTKIPLKDKYGNLIGLFGISRDITDRKLMENVLWTEKEELNVTLRSVGEGVITTNREGKIILLNKKAEEITGFTQVESLNKPLSEAFLMVETKKEHSYLNPVNIITQSETLDSMEGQAILISKNKTDRIINYNASAIKDKDDNNIGFVIVFRDVTEQKKVESQTILSQKMESIGQLAAGIAHEINTPMQYIGDNTRFLKDSFNDIYQILDCAELLIQADDQDINHTSCLSKLKEVRHNIDLEYLKSEIPNAIEQSLTGIDRVRKLVLAMKDFAHPGEKAKALSDLNHGIEVTATISRNEWKYVSDLETNLDSSLPLLYCSLDEINQVILNMIVNAAHSIKELQEKGAQEKGKIKITTKKEDNDAVIYISDTGNGIPKEILNRIYDPFFTTKEVGKGTGQGLAIAHDIIVTKHKGSVQVESEVGKGTTFIIKLPFLDKQTNKG